MVACLPLAGEGIWASELDGADVTQSLPGPATLWEFVQLPSLSLHCVRFWGTLYDVRWVEPLLCLQGRHAKLLPGSHRTILLL